MNDLDARRFETAKHAGRADMRGRINVEGIEEAARIVADAYAAPANPLEHARIQGIILAAFEAGQLHQLNTGTR